MGKPGYPAIMLVGLMTLAALLAPSLVAADDMVRKTDSGMTTSTQPMTEGDLTFMEKAAEDGRTEIAAAQLAEVKSSDPTIRQFAQRIVKDHTAAAQKLEKLAQGKGVTLPASLDTAHQSELDALRSANGKEFDAQYSKMVADAHAGAVALFNRTVKATRDTDIKLFASTTLPDLKAHRALADQLEQKYPS
ncbi:DUF4142 domain-containing protein [Solimonas marina]|uniref:DUF4142 domain-containing protein n=1 Tax=Solimonas marina TaxID=2714601 RepID=A0A969WCN9_9GAMM|nr:DUF4142 domain-containing protein [Solimonas marina]NKF22981.1 DUF4142 domain-containing protein [Solimonas marina]